MKTSPQSGVFILFPYISRFYAKIITIIIIINEFIKSFLIFLANNFCILLINNLTLFFQSKTIEPNIQQR
jgi:hypothetical protein